MIKLSDTYEELDSEARFLIGVRHDEATEEYLRDYIAARAMNGLLSTANQDVDVDELADWAYAISDAMLRKRAEPPKE